MALADRLHQYGDLLEGKPFSIAQQQHLAMVVRQPRQRTLQGAVLFIQDRLIPG
jgi:hypothetical protein